MVKCAECGFLAARNIETRNLEETETAFRDSGVPPVIELRVGGGRTRHEPLPLCFAQRYNLIKEFKEVAGKDYPDRTSVYIVLIEERECESFTEWQLGFTPKEHREMMDRQWMREYQDKREEKDREWRERQEGAQRKWQEEHDRKILTRQIIVFGILVTVALIGGQVFAAFIERGCLW